MKYIGQTKFGHVGKDGVIVDEILRSLTFCVLVLVPSPFTVVTSLVTRE